MALLAGVPECRARRAGRQPEGKGKRPVRMLDHLLRSADLDPAAGEEVFQLMRAPGRHYHGLNHLGLLWSRHRRFAAGSAFAAPTPSRLIACAILFHDAIYAPLRNDNEARSAALWCSHAPADLSDRQVAWVAGTIEATANHLACTDAGSECARLRLWMLDLDLTPLGERPAVFARNSMALRREFAGMDEAAWHRQRIRFMRQVQAAPQIYRSVRLAVAFEQQARRNIAQVLQADSASTFPHRPQGRSGTG